MHQEHRKESEEPKSVDLLAMIQRLRASRARGKNGKTSPSSGADSPSQLLEAVKATSVEFIDTHQRGLARAQPRLAYRHGRASEREFSAAALLAALAVARRVAPGHEVANEHNRSRNPFW